METNELVIQYQAAEKELLKGSTSFRVKVVQYSYVGSK
jgi:hypothetical protein